LEDVMLEHTTAGESFPHQTLFVQG